MYKIAVLIPTTSAKRDWKTFEDTTFFNVFLHSFTQSSAKGIIGILEEQSTGILAEHAETN